jgi:hypothetical protein
MTEQTTGNTGAGDTVTFLFADVQDSTMLWERDPAATRAAHALFEGILPCCGSWGYVATTLLSR